MKIWKCGRFELPIGAKTYVMGIVNATPDSFSGDGNLGQSALEHALRQVEAGADILDIGGESTRPGAVPVSRDEELGRVLPLIEALAARVPDIPLSIDTTKAEVARRAVAAGASIVNDVSGATFDAKMLETVAATNAGLVLMHLRGTPDAVAARSGFIAADPTLTLPASGEGTGHKSVASNLQQARYGPVPSPLAGRVRVGSKREVIPEILAFWHSRLEAARLAAIADNRLCFDAGFGFGKSLDENLEILRCGRELSAFGFPTLSGTSRKSTIGKLLDDAPAGERIFGTAATTALAIAGGADIIRVHDVREMRDVARVCDACR